MHSTGYIILTGYGGVKMKPVIYIDVLFFVNLLINYILLFLTSKIGRLKPGKWRLWIGSLVGAIYSVLMFFPNLQFGYTAAAKFMFSMAIVAVAFNIKGARLYFKTLGIFYLVTLATGGGVLALFYFTGAGAAMGAVLSNGIIYMNLPWQFLTVAIGISYIGIRLVCRMMQSRLAKSNMYMWLSISLGQKKVMLSALVDTGNTLREPISDYPVIIAEYDKLKPILPKEIADIFENGAEINFDSLTRLSGESEIASKLRLVPFCSLGKENGMLLGFKPDFASLIENEADRDIGNVIVCIYNKELAGDRSYCALLNPEVI